MINEKKGREWFVMAFDWNNLGDLGIDDNREIEAGLNMFVECTWCFVRLRIRRRYIEKAVCPYCNHRKYLREIEHARVQY